MASNDIVDGVVNHMRADGVLAGLLPSYAHQDSGGSPATTLNVWGNDIVPDGVPHPVVVAPIGDLADADSKNGTGVVDYIFQVIIIGDQKTETLLNTIGSRIRELFNRVASSITIANHTVLIAEADGPANAENMSNSDEIARAVLVRLTLEDA